MDVARGPLAKDQSAAAYTIAPAVLESDWVRVTTVAEGSAR